MIFATTGAQLPYDRLIMMLDHVASRIDEKIAAQFIPDKFTPHNLEVSGFISPVDFDRYVREARIIVAHAGMGSIISALTYRKPIIVVPRLASLNEHRNDHQTATAEKMRDLGYVYVAETECELLELIGRDNLKPLKQISPQASHTLIDAILNEL